MLSIFELLFFVLGIGLITSKELHVRLLDFLLGKDKYETSNTQTALLSIIVLSPLPVSGLVSYSLVAILGDRGIIYQDSFRIFYLIAVILASIVIVGKTRTPENTQNGSS